MGMKPRPKSKSNPVRDALRAYAFGLPESYEDNPWGESVAKVRKKVFVFFGVGENWGFSVKLPESGDAILSLPFATPTGYGLGKSGWVSITWSPDIPFELMQQWVRESYRAVAPKTLAAQIAAD